MPVVHSPHHSSMFYPKFLISEERIFKIDGSRLPLQSSSTAAVGNDLVFFPIINTQQFSLQTSEFSLRLFINNYLPLSVFFPSSTASSSVFTLYQQRQRSPFFPSINSFFLRLQSSVFDSSSTVLCLSLFFSIINGILFSLHSSSTTSSSIFINNTLLFFPSSRHQWLVDFLFSLHRKLFYL
jgi:hypothetical protein